MATSPSTQYNSLLGTNVTYVNGRPVATGASVPRPPSSGGSGTGGGTTNPNPPSAPYTPPPAPTTPGTVTGQPVGTPQPVGFSAPTAGTTPFLTGDQFGNYIQTLTGVKPNPPDVIFKEPQMSAIAQPLQIAGLGFLNNYVQGRLMPGLEQNINSFIQDQDKRMNDFYAKAGLADSSMAVQDAGEIRRRAVEMRANLNQLNFDQALKSFALASDVYGKMMNFRLGQRGQDMASDDGFMDGLFGAASGIGSLLGGISSVVPLF